MSESVIQGCDLCGDFPVELRAGCHPTAPVRVQMVSPTEIIIRCYVPTCGRVVAKLHAGPRGFTKAPQDCLHCVLSPVVDEFVKMHPVPNLNLPANNIAQVLGEFIAANLHKMRQREALDIALEQCAEVARNSAQELLDSIDTGKTPGRHLNG